MLKVVRVSLSFVAILAIGGCATLKPEECALADWRQIGLADGTRGYESTDRLARHAEACAEVDIQPDVGAYRQGYSEGLGLFCVPATGFRRGLDGYDAVPSVCPAELANFMLDAFALGREVAELRDRRDRLDTQSRTLIAALSDERENDRELAAMREDIRRIEREIAELGYRIENLELAARDNGWL